MPAVLQRLMRHAEIATTMKYYVTMDADEVADEVWGRDWDSATLLATIAARAGPKRRRGSRRGNVGNPLRPTTYASGGHGTRTPPENTGNSDLSAGRCKFRCSCRRDGPGDRSRSHCRGLADAPFTHSMGNPRAYWIASGEGNETQELVRGQGVSAPDWPARHHFALTKCGPAAADQRRCCGLAAPYH